MDEKKNEQSPEEALDELLARFLAEPETQQDAAQTSEAPQKPDSAAVSDGQSEPPHPPVQEDTPMKKKIQKKKKRKNGYGLWGVPHILATAILLVLIVFIGSTAGQLIWTCAADVLAFGREDHSVTITITKNDTLDTICQKLEATGLVEYPQLFKLYAQFSNAMKKIGPGTYDLNTLYDYHALVLMMSPTGSNRVSVKVMIPEGYNCQQIFQLLEQKGVCTAADLEEASATGQLGDYWFLEGVQRGSKYCLEGYLFPDTYEFYVGDSPTRVLNKFLTNFDNRFTDIMEAKLFTLNTTLSEMMKSHGLSQEYIDDHQMTIREVVIIASMIEKESANPAENYTISSVIYNRLTNPGAYPHLNIDAALVYVTGHPQLTEEDKQLDSPYNTYLHEGLIPGPISNPSRSSLDAALEPSQTLYHFYALDPKTGEHHFSATYEEHQAFLDSLTKE